MSANMFYCPQCNKMVPRTKGNEHLQADAERIAAGEPFDAFLLIGRMLARQQSK